MHRLKSPSSRWGNSTNGAKVQTDQLSVIKSPSIFYPNASGCRLSLDGGVLDRRESSSSSTLTDDSVIMSRIRRSCEQKEEFLRNTATPLYSQIIAREFYARPQKFQKTVWPPTSPERDGSDMKSPPLGSNESKVSGQNILKQSVMPLSRMPTNQSFEPERPDSELSKNFFFPSIFLYFHCHF